MKLSERQQDVLDAMRRKPDAIHTAESLNCDLSTLDSLQRRGLVSGVFGETRSLGRWRGSWWKLIVKGKAAEL